MNSLEKNALEAVSEGLSLQLESLWAKLPQLVRDFDLNQRSRNGLIDKTAQRDADESSLGEVTNQMLTLGLSLRGPTPYPKKIVVDKDLRELLERVSSLYHVPGVKEFGEKNLQIVNPNPAEFHVTNGEIILSGDLTRGVVRHQLVGDRSVNFEYSGNFANFRRHGVVFTNDTEEAIRAWGLQEFAEKIIVWHRSDYSVGGLFKKTGLYSVKYEYSIGLDSKVVELAVSVSGIRNLNLTEFRLTTAVDQLSRKIGFSDVEIDCGGAKESCAAKDGRLRVLSSDAIDRLLIVSQELGALKESLLIEPLNRELIDEVRSEFESQGGFHWIYFVYDLGDLVSGDEFMIREKRVVNKSEPAAERNNYLDLELRRRKRLVEFRAVLAALIHFESSPSFDTPFDQELFSRLYSKLGVDIRSVCSQNFESMDVSAVASDLLLLADAGLAIARIQRGGVVDASFEMLKLIRAKIIQLIGVLAPPSARGEVFSDITFEAVLNSILFLTASFGESLEYEDAIPSLWTCLGLITQPPPNQYEMSGFQLRELKSLTFGAMYPTELPMSGAFLYLRNARALEQLRGYAQRKRVVIPGLSVRQIEYLKRSSVSVACEFLSQLKIGKDFFGRQFEIEPMMGVQLLDEIFFIGGCQMKHSELSFLTDNANFVKMEGEDSTKGPEVVQDDSPANLERRFTKVYENNLWGDPESRSGPGSRRDSGQAVHSINVLNRLCSEYRISSISDIPCGDFNWFHDFLYPNPSILYTGYDIVPNLIKRNRRIFRYNFELLDIASQVPGPADLIFCKDLFNHLIYRSIANSLLNMIASQSKFLLASNNFNYIENVDLTDNIGTQTEHGSRHFDLMLAPFNFPQPIWNDHYLGLWVLADIPADNLKRIADNF